VCVCICEYIYGCVYILLLQDNTRDFRVWVLHPMSVTCVCDMCVCYVSVSLCLCLCLVSVTMCLCLCLCLCLCVCVCVQCLCLCVCVCVCVYVSVSVSSVCVYVSVSVSSVCVSYVCNMLIERNPPPREGFLFTVFPDQEPCVRDFTTRCDRRISS